MGDERLAVRKDILNKITSSEADRVTRLMSAIYLRLLRAPSHLWEGGGVLRLAGEMRGGQPVSPREQMMEIVKVLPGTARKALRWLDEEGVIALHAADGRDEIVISFEGLSGRGGGR
jgi:hypothetical protein